MYRPCSGEYKIRDRTIILVDYGIATGTTIVAAVRGIRKQLIIATPVATKKVIEHLKN